MNTKQTLLRSSIVLYFVIAFEVLIMISPFAGFFYTAFNPVLVGLDESPWTRWLSMFYLSHMVLLDDPFLVFVRIMGSVLFVAGIAVFLVCAAQVYAAKLMKKGAVLGGLYARIRHPQYLALCMAGLGLSILWPRILTVVLWLAMVIVYFFLARDEERRMLDAHESDYRPYLGRTGMFLPKAIENRIVPASRRGNAVLAFLFAIFVIGAPFLLRAYTIDHLALWTGSPNVTAVAILPEDGFKMDHRMADILSLPEVKERIKANARYLVYFLPQNYVMQGMIADTGGDWRLYNRHHSIAMITDWIFNPFGHLREGHHAMHAHAAGGGDGGVVRRLIFLSIPPCCSIKISTPSDIFTRNMKRTPEFMADVDVHNLRLSDIRDLPKGSGWGSVPTPTF